MMPVKEYLERLYTTYPVPTEVLNLVALFEDEHPEWEVHDRFFFDCLRTHQMAKMRWWGPTRHLVALSTVDSLVLQGYGPTNNVPALYLYQGTDEERVRHYMQWLGTGIDPDLARMYEETSFT